MLTFLDESQLTLWMDEIFSFEQANKSSLMRFFCAENNSDFPSDMKNIFIFLKETLANSFDI